MPLSLISKTHGVFWLVSTFPDIFITDWNWIYIDINNFLIGFLIRILICLVWQDIEWKFEWKIAILKLSIGKVFQVDCLAPFKWISKMPSGNNRDFGQNQPIKTIFIFNMPLYHLNNNLHSFLSTLNTAEIIQKVPLLLLLHSSRIKVIVFHIHNMRQREYPFISSPQVYS